MPTLIPPWLEPLLNTKFFTVCSHHSDSPRSECNMFCTDCCGSTAQIPPGFCFYCRNQLHLDHHVIQIRRSSYHDVVRVAEIHSVLDIAGVQTYVINSARVLFLNERPQPRASVKAAGSTPPLACEVCFRTLLDPFRFCSLGCKLAGIKRRGDATFVKGEELGEGSSGGEVTGRQENGEEAENDIRIAASASGSSRRRKGVPRRAPFFS